MSDDELDDSAMEDNYYSILNLGSNATIEEINFAYRTLSRIYHPDKHVDVDKKDHAEVLFNKTKKAYEVLSDPHKRAIYDSLGQRGLETEGWEIAHRTKTPAEIRAEYEQLAREREERKLQQRTNPKGNITVSINATDLFNSYGDTDFEKPFLPSIEVSGMSISQSIDAPITVTDTITMSGNLASHNGNGSGGFLISGRRLVNKGWFSFDMGAGNGPSLGLKGSRNLSSKVFCNGGGTVNFHPNGILPGIVGTLAVQLDKHTIGYLTYNAGMTSSMSTAIEHNTEQNHCQLTALIGVPHCFISASYTRKMIEYELKLRVATKVGTFGFMSEYGIEKKVSKYSSVSATVSFGVPSGVSLRLKLTRASQTYLFPIHLSEDIIPAALFYATVTPVLVWFVVKKTIIEPMRTDQKQRTSEKAKETNRQRLITKKREAEAAVTLMSATYDRIRTEEERKHGLVIMHAVYARKAGDELEAIKADGNDVSTSEDEMVDVTIPLQCLIRNSKLVLHKSTKSDLPGFYDPCAGEEKTLQIDYRFGDTSHSVLIQDADSLSLPQASELD